MVGVGGEGERRKEEAEAEAEEGGDKNKRPRMVLSEALLFLRLDQERGISLRCIKYLFIGTLNVMSVLSLN